MIDSRRGKRPGNTMDFVAGGDFACMRLIKTEGALGYRLQVWDWDTAAESNPGVMPTPTWSGEMGKDQLAYLAYIALYALGCSAGVKALNKLEENRGQSNDKRIIVTTMGRKLPRKFDCDRYPLPPPLLSGKMSRVTYNPRQAAYTSQIWHE
jgi:hypothetical protein